MKLNSTTVLLSTGIASQYVCETIVNVGAITGNLVDELRAALRRAEEAGEQSIVIPFNALTDRLEASGEAFAVALKEFVDQRPGMDCVRVLLQNNPPAEVLQLLRRKLSAVL
jgi:hypothetical protein